MINKWLKHQKWWQIQKPLKKEVNMAIFLKIDGFKGEAAATGHEGEINIESVSFDATRRVTTDAGTSSGREGSLAQLSPFRFTKKVCSASPKILQNALTGVAVDAEISFCKQGPEPEAYEVYKLTEAIICQYVKNGSEDGIATETFHIYPKALEYTYNTYNDRHEIDGSQTVGYCSGQAKMTS